MMITTPWWQGVSKMEMPRKLGTLFLGAVCSDLSASNGQQVRQKIYRFTGPRSRLSPKPSALHSQAWREQHMKRILEGMIEAGEPLIQEAIDALRRYHEAQGVGAPRGRLNDCA